MLKTVFGWSYDEGEKENNDNFIEEDSQEIREESNEELEEEYNSEEDEEIDFLKELMYEDDNVQFYATDARNFIPNVKVWSSQRPLNQEYVESLEKTLKTKKHIMGTFKIIRDKEGEIRVIDGQHRIEALKTIMLKDAKYNINLILELYETDTLDSEKSVCFFKDANTVLNVSTSDMPNIKAHNIVSKLCIHFPFMIVDRKNNRKVYRPKCDKKQLYERIKNHLEGYEITDIEFVRAVLKKNRCYGMRSRVKFKKVSERMYEKAKENGFYLGLVKDCMWVYEIND